MLKPEQFNAERKRVRAYISDARVKIDDAIDSELWAYILEFQLGKLDVVKKILAEVERDIGSIPNPVPLPIMPVTPSIIIEAVAVFFKFTPAVLTGRCKEEQVVLARQVAMYLIRQDTDCTLEQIGVEMGGRRPATISHAYMKIASQLPNDSMLRVGVRTIKKKILERVSA